MMHLQSWIQVISDSNSKNGDGPVEVDAAVNLSLEETLGLLCVTKFVAVDRPITLSVFSPQQNRRFLTLDDYTDDQCWNWFRFRKGDLLLLMELLGLDPRDFIYPVHRHSYPMQWSFLLFLCRMAYPGRLQNLEVEFGREYAQLGRPINLILAWLHENRSFRVKDNLNFWVPYQQLFADAVAAKVAIQALFQNVNSFLDGTQKSTCSPSDGPRREEDAQRSWFSGYYRAHGFKVQSMMYPCGKLICLTMKY
jgi:hypothetical protein